MLVSTIIQLTYIIKFFYWESGYFASLDIMHDRFGYYIFWGVTTWLPCVYTLVSLYLVNHPNELSLFFSLFLLFMGLSSIFINYNADAQRQNVRLSNGNCLIWGKKSKTIKAKYKTTDGRVILLLFFFIYFLIKDTRKFTFNKWVVGSCKAFSLFTRNYVRNFLDITSSF